MDTVDKLLFFLFIITLFAMGLIFYVGLSTDTNTFFSGLSNLWSLAMGRVNGGFSYADGGSNNPPSVQGGSGS